MIDVKNEINSKVMLAYERGDGKIVLENGGVHYVSHHSALDFLSGEMDEDSYGYKLAKDAVRLVEVKVEVTALREVDKYDVKIFDRRVGLSNMERKLYRNNNGMFENPMSEKEVKELEDRIAWFKRGRENMEKKSEELRELDKSV